MKTTIKSKLNKFTKFIRNIYETDESENVDNLTDTELLDKFRKCSDCDEEIVTMPQLMHAVIEFDSPKRAYKVLSEMVEEKFSEENEG